MDRAAEVFLIHNDVMAIRTHEWIGDVLVAQSDEDGGWATFEPQNDGYSRPHDSHAAAIKYAEGRAK